MERAKQRMAERECENLCPSSRLENTPEWFDAKRDFIRWGEGRVKNAKSPACWTWDSSPERFARLREQAIQGRRARAEQINVPADLGSDLDYEVMFLWHDYHCAGCGKRCDTYVDHDHRTGLIRGFLCQVCNGQEGRHSEDQIREDEVNYRGSAPLSG